MFQQHHNSVPIPIANPRIEQPMQQLNTIRIEREIIVKRVFDFTYQSKPDYYEPTNCHPSSWRPMWRRQYYQQQYQIVEGIKELTLWWCTVFLPLNCRLLFLYTSYSTVQPKLSYSTIHWWNNSHFTQVLKCWDWKNFWNIWLIELSLTWTWMLV